MADEEFWDAIRAIVDETGMKAVERLVAEGMDPELAGQRIARFNDMFIEELKQNQYESNGDTLHAQAD